MMNRKETLINPGTESPTDNCNKDTPSSIHPPADNLCRRDNSAGASQRRDTGNPWRSSKGSLISSVTSSRSSSTSSPLITPSRRQLSLSVPITRHYAFNNKVLALFDAAYKRQNWMVCYKAGVSFVETALCEIPKHGYYRSHKHADERTQSSLDALRATDILILVAQKLELKYEAKESAANNSNGTGAESVERYLKTPKPRNFEKETASLKNMTVEKVEESTFEKYIMENRDKILADAKIRQNESATIQNHSEADLTLDDLDDIHDTQTIFENRLGDVSDLLFPSGEESVSSKGLEHESFSDLLQSEGPNSLPSSLYPSLLSPQVSRALPDADGFNKYNTSVFTKSVLKKNPSEGGPGLRHGCEVVPVIELRQFYWEDWQVLKSQDKVLFTYLATYQGRLPHSTNGCSVIASLLAVHHLQSDGPGIADDVINSVIDLESTCILPQVRTQLGLTKDSLIIPGDVHHYLMQQGLLSQDQFVGVCGGNIMERAHASSFFQMLGCEGDYECHMGKKVAATLFFREHVIAILKMSFPDGKSWYDLIDSLPSALMMTGTEDDTGWDRNAVRIRCKDIESLETTLRWYSCSKFTEENRDYIDLYQWEDKKSDFDPRVFQSYVWAEWGH